MQQKGALLVLDEILDDIVCHINRYIFYCTSSLAPTQTAASVTHHEDHHTTTTTRTRTTSTISFA